ncbi:MAG: TIGR00645 family protein [Burkholderiales bacterium]|nr:TIGR00645 family protein [Burkholderiales bacterium]
MKTEHIKGELLKKYLGKAIFLSRWTLVPVYTSLVVLIIIYSLRFMNITSSMIYQVLKLDDKHLVLESLNLIDMVMVVNLVLMVLFGGYEIFVSKLRIQEHEDNPEWLTGITTSALKLRISLTIVTISSIEILKSLINIDNLTSATVYLQIWLHLILLISALIIAIVDKLTHLERVVNK